MESDMMQPLFYMKKGELGDKAMDFSNTQHNGRHHCCSAWKPKVRMTQEMTGNTRLIRRFNLYSTNQKKQHKTLDAWPGG